MQNWALILVLSAFAIMLVITVFLDRKTIRRMFIMIAVVFALSLIVFFEFHFAQEKQYKEVRLVLIALRYSATPILLALILFTLVRRSRWYVLIPSLVLAVINIISIFTGIVFSIDDATQEMQRAFILGYLPYAGVAVYSFFLVFVLIRQSNKQASEIIPIVFLALTFASGLVFPFVFGMDYSKIFCTTIAVGLFVYYVFLILQLSKKDPLTGLLNRQAYYASIRNRGKDITAFVSIDMNGLKTINDTQGHVAGDEALTTLAYCLAKAAKAKQEVFRIGGDEFMIICHKTSEGELSDLIEQIHQSVMETKYSCSIGYCYASSGTKNLEEMVKESDEMMYSDKAEHYSKRSNNRRQRQG